MTPILANSEVEAPKSTPNPEYQKNTAFAQTFSKSSRKLLPSSLWLESEPNGNCSEKMFGWKCLFWVEFFGGFPPTLKIWKVIFFSRGDIVKQFSRAILQHERGSQVRRSYQKTLLFCFWGSEKRRKETHKHNFQGIVLGYSADLVCVCVCVFLSGPLRLRVQSRSRARLRIAASIAFLFRAYLKGF